MLLFKQVEIPDFDLDVDFVDTLKPLTEIRGSDCRQKAILPPKGENSPFRK